MTEAMERVETGGGPGVMALAKQLSSSGLIPRALQGKPGDVLVVLLTGKELGLGPMQSLRNIHVVDGKAVLAADLMVGLALGHRDVCEWFRLVESSDTVATYETKRIGNPEPTRMSFTLEQAKAANLTGKQNWRNYAAAMLRARCAAALARACYPDLLAGAYTPDELGHEDKAPPPHVEPSPAPAKRQERASEDAEVVDAKPALDRYRNRKGVVHPPGSSAHIPPEELAEVKAEQDAEKAQALEAGEEKLRQFDAKQTGTLSAPRSDVAKQAKAVEVRERVEKVLGKAPGTVTFGQWKGRAVSELSNAELEEAILFGEAKVAESPAAGWVPKMEECLDLLGAEHDLRLKVPARREPGAEG